MIKLIASDVDGTLVPDGSGVIDPEYYDVIEKLDKKGILFIAASGRQYISLRRLFAPIADRIGYITESGGVVWKEGKCEVLSPIPYDYIMEMASDIRKIEGADFTLTSAERSYLPRGGTRLEKWLREDYKYDPVICPDLNFPKEEKYTKLAIYYPGSAEQKTREFRKKWQGKLHMVLAGDMWLDCVMPGVNKGAALRKIQKDIGAGPEETVTFGDNQNDMELIQAADHAFAVSTAREELKKAAGHVIPSYNENGVLGVLKEILEKSSVR